MRDYRLGLRYNTGSGEQRLELSYVNVSDGQWHSAAFDRVGQWVTLTLDSGEGQQLNESLGQVRGHVELRVSQRGLLAGADVRFPSSNSAPLVSHDFDNGITTVYYFIINVQNQGRIQKKISEGVLGTRCRRRRGRVAAGDETETPNASRGWGMERGCPPPHPTRESGEAS